jgi:hypothetical protein
MQEGKQKALFAVGRVSVRKISSGSQKKKMGLNHRDGKACNWKLALQTLELLRMSAGIENKNASRHRTCEL